MTSACSSAGASIPIRPVRWDSAWPACVPEPQRSAVLGYVTARFGMPLTAFDGLCLLLRHKLYSLCGTIPHMEQLAVLQVQAGGLPVLRIMRPHLKPTTHRLTGVNVCLRRHMRLRQLRQSGFCESQQIWPDSS